jgi:hypothetical protein
MNPISLYLKHALDGAVLESDALVVKGRRMPTSSSGKRLKITDIRNRTLKINLKHVHIYR